MEDFIESLKQRSRQLEIESRYLREMASQMDSQRNIPVSQDDSSSVFTPIFQQPQDTKQFIASPIVRVKLMKPNSSDFNPFTNRITVLSKVHNITTIPSKLLHVPSDVLEQLPEVHDSGNSSVTEPVKEPVKEAVIEPVEEQATHEIKEDNAVNVITSVNEVVPEMVHPQAKKQEEKQEGTKTSSLLSKRVSTSTVPRKKQTFYVPKLSMTPEKKIVPQMNTTKPEPFIKANLAPSDTKIHSIKARLPKMSFVADSIESEDVIPERVTSHFMRPKIMRPRNFIYPTSNTFNIPDITERFPSILPKYLPEKMQVDHQWLEVDQASLAVSSVYIFVLYHEYIFKCTPSVLGLYYASRTKEDKTFDVGTSIANVMEAYRTNGFFAESQWEWNPEMFHMEPVVPKTMEPYTLNIYRLYNDHEIQKCIKDGRPVMVAMTIFNDLLEYSNPDNVVKSPPVDEQPIGTQCFLIIGYDRQSQVYSCVTSLHKSIPYKVQFAMEYVKSYALEMFVVY